MAGEGKERKAYAYSLNKLARQLVFTPAYPNITPPPTALIISEGSLSLNEIKTRMYFMSRPRPRTLPSDPANREEKIRAIQGYIGLGHALVLLANNEPLPEAVGMDDQAVRKYLYDHMGPYIELAHRRRAEILLSDSRADYQARTEEQKIAHWTKIREKFIQQPGMFSFLRIR